ncbi:GvpL/GvpF family gas vesicle protein [Pseudonocardia sp.]|uniref:GvpL/GvpF family gas vesicle protein n=1 Tax=Pseudonocardia sp. TaxID=60912 RepID=UPI003D0FFB78
MTTPTYVYGLVPAGAEVPTDLRGMGPSGRISTVRHGRVAALVSDVPEDRPLGTRDDLVAHETVVDTVAARTTILPMRFPAVVREQGVVEELLAPHEEYIARALETLEGLQQFTLKGTYDEATVLREVLEADEEIAELRARVAELPEDAAYYDRVRLGELVVAALEAKREVDAGGILERLTPSVADVVTHPPTSPEQVLSVALLVDRERTADFENAVEDLGRGLAGRIHLRLLGPLAPYDFVPEE